MRCDEHPAPRGRRAAHRPARPVRIEIPAIGVDAPVIPLGLNPDRTLEVPRDFGGRRLVDRRRAARRTRPGGHRRPRRLEDRPGRVLPDPRPGPGAAIAVVRRDGTRARFRVIGSEQYPKTRFPTERVYGATSRPTLRLITCSGVFDRDSGHYLDNTVVYAVSV